MFLAVGGRDATFQVTMRIVGYIITYIVLDDDEEEEGRGF
jgi:hypothetical protein